MQIKGADAYVTDKECLQRIQNRGLVQKALDDVSLNLRDNEFVAILGPSGSGKTTLLNIIGGLDRYDSGDLIINGISTQNIKTETGIPIETIPSDSFFRVII